MTSRKITNPSSKKSTFLVVGATGQQGGAVVDALLEFDRQDITIRILTRNPSSPAALKLSKRDVEIYKGDLDDEQSLEKALTGVDGAYLVTDFRGPGDVKGEIEQGCRFVDAAKKANVSHLVFSSVAGADIADPVDHFKSKFTIEEYIRSSGLAWTIVRPVGFMEVIPPPGIGRFFFMSAMYALMGNTKQRYIACEDIGKAAAATLVDPERYRGKVITIAGQVADFNTLQSSLAKGESQPGWSIWMPRWLIIRLTPYHYRQMFDWLYFDNCQPGEPAETKKVVPGVLTIEEWARKQRGLREQ